MREEVVAMAEKEFILTALRASHRLDGRRPYDIRSTYISFGQELGQVTVQLGETRVMTVVTSSIVNPRPNRPTEGFFQFQVEFSPMASVEYDNERRTSSQVELGRIVERGLRDSRAIDTEALCIVAGEKVWAIRCHIHILDHGGNLIDCASLATIIALLHFRRPDVTVIGEEVTVHTLKDRLPVPLSVHHIPIAVTFAIFDDGMLIACDPTYKEEETMESRMTITLNAQEEICAIQKAGGTPLPVDRVLECTRIAAVKVKELDALVKESLDKDAQERKGQQPISLATTPACFTKQERWESIYQKDQENMDKEEKKKVIQPKIVQEKEEKDSKKTVDIKTETEPQPNLLFGGGASAWEEPVEKTKAAKQEEDTKMTDAADSSEEEETVTLKSTEKAPKKVKAKSKSKPKDLAAALKPKKKGKKAKK